jgi:prepilin-type N-terminal cleavage/methylation domain-containing protein
MGFSLKSLAAASLLFVLASCASLNPLDILNPDKPSLEVSAQVGKTNEVEKSNIKLESGKQEIKQEAEKITNDNNYTAESMENIVQGMSLVELLIVIVLAGIAIPSIDKVYKGIKVVISDVWSTVAVTPARAIFSIFKKE